MKRIFTIVVYVLFAVNMPAQYSGITVRMPNSPYLKIVQIDFREVSTLVYMQYSNVESTEAICISRAAYMEIERSKYRLINAHNVPVCGQTVPPERNIFNFVLEFEKAPVVAEFDIVEPLGRFNIFGIKINTVEKVNFSDVAYFTGSNSVAPVDMAYTSQAMQQIPAANSIAVKKNKNRRRYIGISAGASVPIGDFADKSMNNLNAGFAKTGFQINMMDFGFLFSKHIGIAGKWFGGQYSIDEQGFDNPWVTGGIMFGPLFSVGNDIVAWDFRPSIGYGVAIFPESNYSESSLTDTNMFGMGTTFRINAAPKLAFLIGLDYLYANPEFNVEQNTYGYSSFRTLNQKINTVTVSLGIAISWTK
jgi:hypothetical protein